MRFSIWPNPQRSWEDTLEAARCAEQLGYDGVWFADHFMPDGQDLSPPRNEAWTTLAALAAAVPRVRLGTLVTGNTYRHPAVLAKMAASVDVISGGRLVLGLGAGWQENEHRAYGIEFDTVAGRLDRLEEACALIRSLFARERTTFEGRYYQLRDAPLEPKPVQQPLPLLIGGGGERRTLRIAAKYADEWNTWGEPELMRHKMAVLDRHCAELGRDPTAILRSAVALVVLHDDAAVVERWRATGRPLVGGTVEQVRAVMEHYADAGVDEFIMPDWNLRRAERRDVYERFMKEVASHFRDGSQSS